MSVKPAAARRKLNVANARHTRPPGQSAPLASDYQLTGEDYENIWLRLRNRFWLWVLGWFAVIATLGGYTAFQLAKRQLDEAVAAYVKSDEFRARLPQLVAERLPHIDAQLQQLETRQQQLTREIASKQQQLVAMQKFPLELTPVSVRWTVPDGRSFQLQTGRIAVGGFRNARVQFTESFKTEPFVLISPAQVALGRLSRQMFPHSITSEGFAIQHEGEAATVHWIALGQ